MKRKTIKEPWTSKYFAARSIEDLITGCHIWQGATTRNGYGMVRYNGKNIGAHRLIYMLHHSCELPSEIHVCHKCDNRRCVNLDHLFSGDKSVNMKDCYLKGRAGGCIAYSQRVDRRNRRRGSSAKSEIKDF